MSTTEATYRKTRTGEWVVFGPVAVVKPGIVTVVKANSVRKAVIVERVGKTFTADGVACCYGYITEPARTNTSRPATRVDYRSHGRHTCHIPGAVCDECA